MKIQHLIFLAALFVALFIVTPAFGLLAALVFTVVVATALNRPSERLCATLSVPEILMDVMDAFKTEVPMMLSGFSTDFSSKTAVYNDTIYAHISTLPTVRDYDATDGFNKNQAAADTLLTDVPVVLNTFHHVPVKVTWLTQLASKMPLYREAIRNIGYVMAKKVVDDALAKVVAANFSHTEVMANANVSLDSLESIRTTLNTQKAYNRGRFGIVSSGFAAALQNDDRVKSSLFYGVLNGNQGYRTYQNMAGFENIWEYPDFPANAQNLSAFFGDKRSIVIANRRVDFSNAASELGVPQIMQFYPMSDPDTGLQMTGVAWQQPGTGDVTVSAAVLYGISAGNQGGAADAITDKAGYRITTA